MTKTLPSAITSYDLWKTLAVIAMIVDHIGYYFYPENEWWRAIGRMSFPIWLFLVGYANSRDLSPLLWGGAVFLLAMNIVVGQALFPLNILITILLVRLTIDFVMGPVARKPDLRWFVFGMSALLVVPTNSVFEYGTQALLFAMGGYMVRHREGIGYTKAQVQNFMIALCLFYLAFQFFSFGFSPVQFAVAAAGTIIVCALLCDFRAASFPALTKKLPAPITWFLQLCGRRTLEIYVLHLTLFKIAALLLDYPKFQLFNFHIF